MYGSSLELRSLSKVARALGDPYRLRIINSIAKHPEGMNYEQISRMFVLSQPTISYHLKVLCNASLLIDIKQGRTTMWKMEKTSMDKLRSFLTSL